MLTGVAPVTTPPPSAAVPVSLQNNEEDMTIIKGGDTSDNTESIHSNCSDTETGGYMDSALTSNGEYALDDFIYTRHINFS